MSDVTPEDLISPSKAARLLGVHLATVYRWALTGKLRSWRLGKLVRVSAGEVRAMLKPRQVEAPLAVHSAKATAARRNWTAEVMKDWGFGETKV